MLCVYSTFETSCWLDRTGSGLQITSLRKQPTFCGAIIVCCLVCSRIMTSVAPDWSYREEISLVITVNAIRITVGLTSDTLTWNLSALSPKSLNRRRPGFYRLSWRAERAFFGRKAADRERRSRERSTCLDWRVSSRAIWNPTKEKV